MARNWALDREFKPQMPADQRDERYAQWQEAVKPHDWLGEGIDGNLANGSTIDPTCSTLYFVVSTAVLKTELDHSPETRLTSRLDETLAAVAATALASHSLGSAQATQLLIAPFRFDVTPPVGHPLCGGWIKPAVDCQDELEAIGFVLLGAGQPIVICAVDWTGILNEAHVAWRTAMAEAAGTTPDRVAVQCVHQHDAPFVCLHAEKLVEQQHDGLEVVQMEFFRGCLDRAKRAIKRRDSAGPPGDAHRHRRGARWKRSPPIAASPSTLTARVGKMRGSSCRDVALIALPEGLIDPLLKTVAFYEGDKKIVACHYYATHPMSHYGAGHVSSDFVGLARKQRQSEELGLHAHLLHRLCRQHRRRQIQRRLARSPRRSSRSEFTMASAAAEKTLQRNSSIGGRNGRRTKSCRRRTPFSNRPAAARSSPTKRTFRPIASARR